MVTSFNSFGGYMADDSVFNAQQAADYLGYSRQRVYLLAKQGRLGREYAGFWVFDKSELDTYKATTKRKGGRPRKITNSPYAIASS